MNRAVAIFRLTRAEHSVMLAVAVVVAELIAGGLPSAGRFAISLLPPIFISMGAFAINDYYDVDSDRANGRRDRPLVAGALTKRDAVWVTAACMLIGVAASALVGIWIMVISLAFSVVAVLYSYRLKDTVLVGNGYIALTMAVPFLYGDLAVSSFVPVSIILICMVAFLSGLAREIHGMIRDRTGDSSARHSRNLVLRIGAKQAAWIALILYAEAIAVSTFLFFYAGQAQYNPFAFNLSYIIPMTAINIMLFYVGARIAVNPNNRAFLRASRNISLGAMGLALLVYILAQAFPISVVPF